MGKKYKKKNYNYKYRKKNYFNNEEGKDAFLTVALIVIVFILLWAIFWIGVISLTILIIYLTHKLNNYFYLYNTRYFYGAIITFLISTMVILFGGSQIAYNMGKINNTFWGWAVESSDYLKLNYSKGKMNIAPNTEGILQKGIINSITSTGNNLK